MTSASELFHSRRYRFGLRHNAVDVSGFDSSRADANSSSSHQHRTTNRRRNHHYNSQNNRREHRHDLDVFEPASRRIHRRRLDHSEGEAEEGRSQSPSGSGSIIINTDDLRSMQRPRGTGSDRLPGAVLLARERLVERLRGVVSVSGNSGSSSSSSTIHQHDFPSSVNNSFMGIEMSAEALMAMCCSSQETRTKHPQHAFNCLALEVFRNDGERDETSRECTICLEGFQDGDELIRLHCTHTFHSCCLFPWVRVCGACPNCRKAFVMC